MLDRRLKMMLSHVKAELRKNVRKKEEKNKDILTEKSKKQK
jgi:hypothetical protein